MTKSIFTQTRWLVTILFVIFSVSRAWADTTATLTLSDSNLFGTSSGSQKNDNQGNTWTCTGSSIQNQWNTTYNGQQFGSKNTNNSYTFTCTIANVTITSVKATMAAGNSTPTYSISVGGASKYSGNLSTTATQYGGSSATGTGEICITINQNSASKAVYLGAIEVKYTTASCSVNPSATGNASINGSFS